MTNFEYLSQKKEFDVFASACIEAENSLSASPALCALGCRKAAELAVKWLYSADDTLSLPFNDNFSALFFNPSFVATINENLLGNLKYIQKIGNIAAHTNKVIQYRSAVLALSNLFEFIKFIDYCYGNNYQERTFDEDLLSASENKKLAITDIEKLEKKGEENEKLLEQVKVLQEELKQAKAANISARSYKPSDLTEAETRKEIIDMDISEMGWVVNNNCISEYETFQMGDKLHNPNGKGYVDYVFLGDNGKPLAVLEAKRATRSPREGEEQARQYARSIEKETGVLPLCFYTNGYETWFWDIDNYPARQVSSIFSKGDMERIINRRMLKKDFSNLQVNNKITDRLYQKEAIHHVCTHFRNGNRKALLVMATGTGKTRTAISLADILTKNSWVTNILFLADRRELVSQAKKAFKQHLPNLSCCNLLQYEKGEEPTDRAIFSTYPTIMNAINKEKTPDGKRLFTPGHFDLIIIDEAHRSIFKKYRAIFNYFDSLIVGLTATPKSDIDKNTYSFFDLEDHMPTFAYEYETALKDGYLSDYYAIEKLFKLPTQGQNIRELNEREKEAFEDAFEEGEEVPDHVNAEQINTIYLNKDTNRRVLEDLMTKGLKIEGGDKLGKTIIFARNHEHAIFIKDQFDKMYPQYKGEFAKVIDNYEKRAQSIIDDFKTPEKYPQIAISVDMLDTGIDVPEILNLVFFKRVMSESKFWQMFGRGTRLCEGLNVCEGEQIYPDKKHFYVFDYLGNIEYWWRQEKKGIEGAQTPSLAEKTFELKVKIIYELQQGSFTDYSGFRQVLVDEMIEQIKSLKKNRQQFQVREQLQYVDRYSDSDIYNALTTIQTEEIIAHLSKIIPAKDEDESARRFDVLAYGYILSLLTQDVTKMQLAVNNIKNIATELEKKATIPAVYKNIELIRDIQSDEFWQNATIPKAEEMRIIIRELMYCLRSEIKRKKIDISDTVLFENEGQRFIGETKLDSYYKRAADYVEKNKNQECFRKLRENKPLTKNDWEQIEEIFWQNKGVGTKDEYEKEYPNTSLGRFVRGLTGLDSAAVKKAFSVFLDGELYSAEQIQTIHYIIEALEDSGTLNQEDMAEDNFFGDYDLFAVWDEKNKLQDWQKVTAIIDSINNNAERSAA